MANSTHSMSFVIRINLVGQSYKSKDVAYVNGYLKSNDRLVLFGQIRFSMLGPGAHVGFISEMRAYNMFRRIREHTDIL